MSDQTLHLKWAWLQTNAPTCLRRFGQDCHEGVFVKDVMVTIYNTNNLWIRHKGDDSDSDSDNPHRANLIDVESGEVLLKTSSCNLPAWMEDPLIVALKFAQFKREKRRAK